MLGIRFDVGVLYECGVLDDILFIYVGFVRVWVEWGGELDRVWERWCGDGVFCYGFGVGVWVGNS